MLSHCRLMTNWFVHNQNINLATLTNTWNNQSEMSMGLYPPIWSKYFTFNVLCFTPVFSIIISTHTADLKLCSATNQLLVSVPQILLHSSQVTWYSAHCRVTNLHSWPRTGLTLHIEDISLHQARHVTNNDHVHWGRMVHCQLSGDVHWAEGMFKNNVKTLQFGGLDSDG